MISQSIAVEKIKTIDIKNILVVEDNIELLDLLKDIFEGTGSRVFTARTGSEALEIFDQNNIDTIVSDLAMPVMDGMEFYDAISQRTENVTHQPKVFFLTGSENIVLIPRQTEGSLDYKILHKPFKVKYLIDTVINNG